jgi:hypothetical protein
LNGVSLGGQSSNHAPTVAVPASASPTAVTGTSVNLSVLGADDGGESNLSYTWTAIGNSPTGVSFSANGTNAAKNSTAKFTSAGTYTFRVTIKDSSNLTTTSTVTVTVKQTLTTIILSPTTASLYTNSTQHFTATAKDQFGKTMATQPTFKWSLASGGVGSISTSGVYSTGATAGKATVRATNGSITGTSAVTVTAPVKVNLSSSFNRIGFTTDGTKVTGTGIDGAHNTYSANLLLGSSLATQYKLGSSNVNNVVAAAGQTIALTQGKFSTLTFLGAGINGAKPSKTFVVHYTDGTSQTFIVSLSNWETSSDFAGETIAQSMSYRNTTTGGRTTSTTDLYQYSLTLNKTKTIASITLPGDTNTVIVAAIDLNP